MIKARITDLPSSAATARIRGNLATVEGSSKPRSACKNPQLPGR